MRLLSRGDDMAIFGGTDEMKEKQFKRLLKAKRKSYIVEEQADEMVKYAESKGVKLEKIQYNFLTILEVIG